MMRKEQFCAFISDSGRAYGTMKAAFEACGACNYWAREFNRFGHQAKIIPAASIKP